MNFKYYDYEESYFVYADGLCDLERHFHASWLRFAGLPAGIKRGAAFAEAVVLTLCLP